MLQSFNYLKTLERGDDKLSFEIDLVEEGVFFFACRAVGRLRREVRGRAWRGVLIVDLIVGVVLLFFALGVALIDVFVARGLAVGQVLIGVASGAGVVELREGHLVGLFCRAGALGVPAALGRGLRACGLAGVGYARCDAGADGAHGRIPVVRSGDDSRTTVRIYTIGKIVDLLEGLGVRSCKYFIYVFSIKNPPHWAGLEFFGFESHTMLRTGWACGVSYSSSALVTLQYSSSTGVARPKIITITRTLP